MTSGTVLTATDDPRTLEREGGRTAPPVRVLSLRKPGAHRPADAHPLGKGGRDTEMVQFISHLLARLRREGEDGQTLVEYGLLLALIPFTSLVGIGVVCWTVCLTVLVLCMIEHTRDRAEPDREVQDLLQPWWEQPASAGA